jgi:hypothetical protein
MGPDRTNHSRKNARAGPSTVTTGPKALSMDQRDGSGVPGVSKLKASLRQTKRLLAKVRRELGQSEGVADRQENLEPGLRITTERRLVSLEADLANALKRDVEKKNGAKYHQVKFFGKPLRFTETGTPLMNYRASKASADHQASQTIDK